MELRRFCPHKVVMLGQALLLFWAPPGPGGWVWMMYPWCCRGSVLGSPELVPCPCWDGHQLLLTPLQEESCGGLGGIPAPQSLNHGMVCIMEWLHLVQSPHHEQGHLPLDQVSQGCVQTQPNVPRNGASISLLGNQCFTTHIIKISSKATHGTFSNKYL